MCKIKANYLASMSGIDSNEMIQPRSFPEESENSQGSGNGESSPRTSTSDGEGEARGQQGLRRSSRKRIQREPRDRELVAEFLSSGKVRKAGPSKASSGRRASGKGRVARMGGGQEYRVQGLDGVRHRLGQPIEFKVNWMQTWVPFHALRGKELFEEARAAIKETLGYSTWEAQEGPVSHTAALDLNEEVEYESE